MTEAELEQSARIVEAELRKIREATGMRTVVATASERDVYWYACDKNGTHSVRDTLAEALISVEVQRRKAAAK